MTPQARVAAVITLLDEISADKKRPADAVAGSFFRARRYIGSGDRREISEAVWAVLRCRFRLEWWLKRIGARDRLRMQVAAFCVLAKNIRLAELETLFNGERFAEPPLSREELRCLSKLPGGQMTHPEMDEVTASEIPPALFPYFKAQFQESLAEEAKAFIVPAPLDLRVNLLKTTREEAKALLLKEGFRVEETKLSPFGLRINARVQITATEVFKNGLIEIQDEGSQLIPLIAGVKPGLRVLDYCAGAGGKTLALAMLMKNKGQIVAADVSSFRLEAAKLRLRRAGVSNAERHLFLAGDKWLKRHRESFDTVLVDAPCSGTGTWRRNPDARLSLSKRDIEELVVRQRAILAKAAETVRPQGKLVYATCSVLAAENEQQAERFLTDHPDFEAVEPALILQEALWPIPPEVFVGGEKYLALTPARSGTDGFFAAVFRKKAGAGKASSDKEDEQ